MRQCFLLQYVLLQENKIADVMLAPLGSMLWNRRSAFESNGHRTQLPERLHIPYPAFISYVFSLHQKI